MSAPRTDIAWAKGGHAELMAIGTDNVKLLSTVPAPPGSRIDGEITMAPRAAVRFKVHASKKQDDGAFVIEGRPIDLPKEIRERLVAIAGAAREEA